MDDLIDAYIPTVLSVIAVKRTKGRLLQLVLLRSKPSVTQAYLFSCHPSHLKKYAHHHVFPSYTRG